MISEIDGFQYSMSLAKKLLLTLKIFRLTVSTQLVSSWLDNNENYVSNVSFILELFSVLIIWKDKQQKTTTYNSEIQGNYEYNKLCE